MLDCVYVSMKIMYAYKCEGGGAGRRMCLRGTFACDQVRGIGRVVSQGSQRGIVLGFSQPFLLLSLYYSIQSLNLNHVHGFYLLGV